MPSLNDRPGGFAIGKPVVSTRPSHAPPAGSFPVTPTCLTPGLLVRLEVGVWSPKCRIAGVGAARPGDTSTPRHLLQLLIRQRSRRGWNDRTRLHDCIIVVLPLGRALVFRHGGTSRDQFERGPSVAVVHLGRRKVFL